MTTQNTIKRSTTFNDDNTICTVVRSVKKSNNQPVPTRAEWEIDLSTFTHEEILQHAVANIVIDIQTQYRKDNLVAVQKVVKDDLKSEAKPRQPSKKNAMAFLEGMTPEERNEWLEENGLI